MSAGKWYVQRMQDDPTNFDARPGYGCVEMPSEVASLENREGRLLVTLKDGRLIDMTDWFSDEAPKH